MATGNSVIENKLVQLKLIVGRTKKILESGNQEAVERQQRALRIIVADIYKCKVEEEEARMIDEKRELTEISEWNSNIEEKLSEADKNIHDLRE
jgi:phosphopantothenoylcysteine synthetase/decarboxylase